MTEKSQKFILSNRDALIALITEWNDEVLEEALGQDKSEAREYLIDFVRFLKLKISVIKNIDRPIKGKVEQFI